MSTANHPNSRRVTIFRAPSFIQQAQGKEAAEYFAQTKEAIGSYWEKVTSQRIGSGLSYEEEELLMPRVIDIPKDDREFRKKCREFFSEMNTVVPYEGGVTLEIGLTKSNVEKVSETNLPLNIVDYITYRHAAGHPQTAASKADAEGNQMIKFYIFDRSAMKSQNAKKNEEKDRSYKLFLQIQEKEEQIEQMLTLLGVDIRSFEGPDASIDKKERLRDLAETKPNDFLKAHEEGNIADRAWIQNMVNTGVLKEVGKKFLNGEDSAIIANNIDEMLQFLQDPDQSDVVQLMKARYQEAKLKPLPTQVRRTQELT